LLSLIQDILDVSLINAGMMVLDFEAVDLRELAQSMLDAVRAMVQDKPISLVVDIDLALPPIRADKRRLRQIMLNLLSNAAKFTEVGQISVQAQVIRAFNPDNGQMEPFVEVSVSDTGIGIPRDRQSEIFKEFAQADGSTTRRHEGIGLGLPITKRLVELHGGRIWVKSQVGQGTTFAFSLPLSQPERRASQTLEVVEAPGQEVSYVA
jgi:signal transduction histidine kinase